MRFPAIAGAAAVVLALTLAAPPLAGAAITAPGGGAVDNTSWTTTDAQLASAPGCAGLAPAAGCKRLAEPGSPADDAPEALAALGTSGAPEDDLEAALRRLAEAADPAAASAAITEAVAILEGRDLAGRAYSGIPLLNWNAPAKVRSVPAGGTVEVREVRFPGHSVSDSWLLDFEDPSRPYTVRYRITELAGTVGGELKPAALLADGDTRLGAVHSTLLPLMAGNLATGTLDRSRFTTPRGLAAGAPEETRLAEQVVEVRMPPPHLTRAILSPSTRPHAPSLLTLAPATEAARDAAAAAFGFAGADPTAAERTAAIERLAVTAPERQLWDDLRALPAADDPGFLAAAQAIGAQDGTLVDAMRTRDVLPAGVGADPDADVTLVLQNDETYVSRSSVRPAGADAVRVRVVNRDGFAHHVSAIALHDRAAVLGADDWGRFSWTPVDGGAVAAGESATFTVAVPADAFGLWLGDAGTGDQASTVVELERGPRVQAVQPAADPGASPLHQAMDAGGDLWVSLAGIDAVARVTPAADFATSARSVHFIPGGRHTPTSPEAALEPADVAVDRRGVIWTTLIAGNAVARIDPSAAHDGTTDGVTVYRLPACVGEEECPLPFGADPGTPPSRMPLQMEVTADAAGNTLVWFTESNVDRIGLLRVAPDGRELGQTHFDCGCTAPLGLALDAAGDVWFTEGVDNRVGRLTPGVTEPYAAAAATLRHYAIPSAVLTSEPELSPLPVLTSNPHSVTVDRRGLVWFTESATSKVGVLDVDRARPGTTDGMAEFDLPHTAFGTAATPADLTVDRAGTVFWTDEYGDIVGTVDATGPRASWAAGRSFRPLFRRSFTDSPLVTPAGDLVFVEGATNRLTKVDGVSAGLPALEAHARVAVDLDRDAVLFDGLAEAATLDVVVRRDGAVVARADDVTVTAGAAEVHSFSGAADPLRAGDRVEVLPHGAGLQAAFASVLPALGAQAAGGRVTGKARLGGQVPSGAVSAPGGRTAAIDPLDGSWALDGAAATVSWTVATPAATWVTTDAVAAERTTDPGTGGGTTTDPGTGGGTPTDSGTPAPSTTPEPSAPVTDDEPSDPATTPAGCPRHWLTAGRRVALLGLTTARLDACMGRPVARRGAVRRYTGGLELTLRRGRVVEMTLTGGGWASERGGLQVGARSATVRAAVPAARTLAGGVRHARLRTARGKVAELRVTVRDGRVRRITVREVAR